MKFPRKASADADAHTSALDRLQEARDEQQQLGEERDGAKLAAAGEHVAAREAWARWAERDD